jgi:hypothetical protein
VVLAAVVEEMVVFNQVEQEILHQHLHHKEILAVLEMMLVEMMQAVVAVVLVAQDSLLHSLQVVMVELDLKFKFLLPLEHLDLVVELNGLPAAVAVVVLDPILQDLVVDQVDHMLVVELATVLELDLEVVELILLVAEAVVLVEPVIQVLDYLVVMVALAS